MTNRLADALDAFSRATEQCLVHVANDGVCPNITLQTLCKSRQELHDAIQNEPVEKGTP